MKIGITIDGVVRDFITKLPKVFLELLIVIVITILTYVSLFSLKENTEIIAILGVFSLTAIKALPHMSTLLSSVNTFKFSKSNYFINSKDKKQRNEKKTYKKEITACSKVLEKLILR